MKIRKAFLASGSILVVAAFAACSGGDSNGGTVGGVGATTGTGGSTSTGGKGGGDSGGPCTPGEKTCSGQTPQTCGANGTWSSSSPCPYICANGACTGSCVPGSAQCNGQTPQTCDATGNWNDGAPCQYVCSSGACAGVCTPGSTQCKGDVPQTCGTDGKWTNANPCPYGCDNGTCKPACTAGEFHCDGNEVQQCDVGPPPQWVSKSPALICNAMSGQACDATTGTCKTLTPLGSTTPTGTYYEYAVFDTSNSPFKGGYDVDSFENYIYVNRGGSLDVYKVELLDSDGDGKLEPDQHPNNPANTGPIEQRVLTFVQTYTNAPMGSPSTAELYALSDRIFALGPSHNGTINEFIFATGATTPVVAPALTSGMSQMGFGDLDGLWYASNEGNRRVYSWHAKSNSWVAEFAYPDLAGSHMDGMEVIVSPGTGEQYVFVSDMTSDFIGQYRKDPTGWTQVNLFQYNDVAGALVEGMGFGAFNHFWVTGGSYLYELGGGDLAKYLE